MKLTFLGTGTSVGVPIIGCDCAVCTSSDPRNKRCRASLHIEAGDTHLIVDTSPDFRQQALTFKIPRVDAVFFTHSHADHIFGFDDIRRYNTLQDEVIPAFGLADTIEDLRRIFDYVDVVKQEGVYRPRIEFGVLEGPVEIGDVTVEHVEVDHSDKPTCGYIIRSAGKSAAYVPDCRSMDDATIDRFAGVDIMILDALRHHPHKTHMTVEQSVALLQKIGADRSYIVHMTHDLDHQATQDSMPEGVTVSWDGLVVDV